MERGLLSDEKLQERYDDVVWMYLFQDFGGSDTDRAAERVAIRFGITVWPQHFLVDPHTLDVLADTGRSLESFGAAVDGAKVSDAVGAPTAKLREFDAVAASLETGADTLRARELLGHEDIVVRFRAVQRLFEVDPASVVASAVSLLAHGHDQTRFLVCQAIVKMPDAATDATRAALEDLTRTPAGSKNPNVLRIRAVQALGAIGDAGSIAAIEPHATSGVWFNGLTGVSVDALRDLGRGVPDARPAVVAALRKAFPVPPVDTSDARSQRACTALARRVHEGLEAVTGAKRPFPQSYDAAQRARLQQSW